MALLSHPARTVFLIAASLTLAGVARGGDSPKTLPAKPSSADVLAHLERLAPADRMRFLDKLPAKERPTVAAAKGPVTPTIVERGTLQAVKSTPIICTVKATKKNSTVAAVIKWVVDDGAWVKKGDKLIEFDNTEVLDRASELKAEIAQAEAELRKAAEHHAATARASDIDIQLAEVDVKLADLARQQYKGDDAVKKNILTLQFDRQVLLLKRVKAVAGAKTAQAAADLDARKAIRDQEVARLRELEAQAAKLIVHAPHDGFVVYYVPEQTRIGAQQAIVAQGEPVREGQKLLIVADLKQMAVRTRIHEAVIAKVRAGQKATVRVDAFPGKVESGKVTEVATVADQSDFFSKDVKVYQVMIAIDGENKTMKPGMSATVELTLGEKADCLRIPASAIINVGKNRGCFVVSDNELQLRRARFGVADANFAEVLDGVNEGDLVLANPTLVARRIAEMLGGGKIQEKGKAKPTQIRIRSVKPKDDGEKRKLVHAYGLLHEDLDRITLLADVADVVPVRTFAHEIRRLDRLHVGHVIATTAAYANAKSLQLAAGRFLSDADDMEDLRNVVVLGAAAAEKLSPNASPVDQTLVLNKNAFVIVGVLSAIKGDDAEALQINNAVFMPLKVCRERFGTRIFVRESGKRELEEVELNEILLTVKDGSRVAAAAKAITAILEKSHSRRDWEIHVGP